MKSLSAPRLDPGDPRHVSGDDGFAPSPRFGYVIGGHDMCFIESRSFFKVAF